MSVLASIRSMGGILSGLVEAFDSISEADAAAALRDTFGIEAVGLVRLDTERDDTFRVATADAVVLLKVAHPGDDPGLVELQNLALRRIAEVDPELPVPRVLHTGAIAGRSARVLSWLSGQLMLDSPRSAAQLRAAGETLGRLSRALAPLDHPAAHRILAWDLQRLPLLADATTDPALVEFVERFEVETMPRLADLPHQLVHNDFHPSNVLVDPADPMRITGVLDFGDAVHTARVVDLGVALAYVTPEEGSVYGVWQPLLDGYESVVPLLDSERELVPVLAAARQVQRIVINEALGRARNEIREAPRVRRQLARIEQLIEEE
jgi:hydroxylysine kinase